MTFVAAAVPRTEPWRDHDLQVLADAENVIVGVLFDDIVRTLVGSPTALGAGPVPMAVPRRGRMSSTPVRVGRQSSVTAWARSPPWMRADPETVNTRDD
ncbi:hypothetical protein [Cryobacterium arcticum]|uniref:Uncharacterized protein n=1 Tax=Cryobacterium arcticum TaxID=670052 RepID=A0A317ZPC0_9MICO|nr:hypothetical protein [Cryobacterium arcticum]PXA68331.1 hypothetical protein CTB96_17085 [Cryobacterium arcticum]